MTSAHSTPRLTSFAPQFLVDDLVRSIAYYRRLVFTFGEPWGGFDAIGILDGLELHLKEAPKNDAERHHRRQHEHLDASGGVDGIEAFYAQCVANGATILRPLAATAWGTEDFYVVDPDGYVIAFGGRPSASGRMRVLEHQPGGWFLLGTSGRLLLDVACEHHAVGYSVLIELNAEERGRYLARGRPYVKELAEEISRSAPGLHGSRSAYSDRDISSHEGAEVAAAIAAWRLEEAAGAG